jgi:hypothetical protein
MLVGVLRESAPERVSPCANKGRGLGLNRRASYLAGEQAEAARRHNIIATIQFPDAPATPLQFSVRQPSPPLRVAAAGDASETAIIQQEGTTLS